MTEPERRARLVLSRLVEPGHRGLHEAVASLGAVEVQQELSAGRRLPGLTQRLTDGIALRAAGVDLAADQRHLEACGGRILCPGDEEWPTCLDWDPHLATAQGARLEAPPLLLFVRGPRRLDDLVRRSVAVVGARAATRYGESVATELAAGLVGRGWSVVSGGGRHRRCCTQGRVGSWQPAGLVGRCPVGRCPVVRRAVVRRAIG